jgi:hypothetical protein
LQLKHLAASVAVMALAGCAPIASSSEPIAVRSNAGVLEVAVCTSWSLTSVLVQTRATGFMSSRETPWAAEGSAELVAVDVLTSTAPPAGFTATTWGEPVLAPADELSVTLGGEGDKTLTATFVVPLSGLPRSDWLQDDGSITAAAC